MKKLPLQKLIKNQTEEVWYTLQNLYNHYSADNFLNDDGSMSVQNEQLAMSHDCSISTISRAIKKLAELEYIRVEYKESRYGRERRIWIDER